jgi:Ribbon-helix-helix protein, copG family
MVTMTVKLPPATSARLSAAARVRRVSKSQIVREALEKHLKYNGKSRRPTFGELAGHLAGSLKGGPGDLSTNPKHMEGFGE